MLSERWPGINTRPATDMGARIGLDPQQPTSTLPSAYTLAAPARPHRFAPRQLQHAPPGPSSGTGHALNLRSRHRPKQAGPSVVHRQCPPTVHGRRAATRFAPTARRAPRPSRGPHAWVTPPLAYWKLWPLHSCRARQPQGTPSRVLGARNLQRGSVTHARGRLSPPHQHGRGPRVRQPRPTCSSSVRKGGHRPAGRAEDRHRGTGGGSGKRQDVQVTGRATGGAHQRRSGT